MTERKALPLRRHCETFEIAYGGFDKHHTITVGFYNEGNVGEVFINGGKSGEMVQAIARDGAILLSLALQYGADLQTVKHALTRDSRDAPMSIIGVVVDRLVGE
jgi:hypothetical protein